MKKINFKEGFSESAWKSLVVKSLRIGWVEGLEKAASVLPKSTMKNLLICGLFEDVFPATFEELDECINEIIIGDYEALCKRETHHGRGYSQQFFDMATEACEFGPKYGAGIAIEAQQKTNIGWVNPRVFNCLYTWRKIMPKDVAVKRDPFRMPFAGMPKNILDGHTYEGKQSKSEVTLLSGHYENHLAIGLNVLKNGWKPLRDQMKNDSLVFGNVPVQQSLF